ncbi:hypothetical protein TWF506_005492 [Arthrobotrys conoides]|uniref:Uncharacterized protein n=1 Tax=Arthrobotrys conoides TaxID=74498 RepID=A0AAN8PPU7_9PEZI
MGLLDRFAAHQKDRKSAKGSEETQDQLYDTEALKSISTSFSQRFREDFRLRVLRKIRPELQPTAKLEKPSSTPQNAGSSINISKRPTSGQGPVPVQEEQRAPPKNDTRPKNIPSDGNASSSDPSSTTSKKRSAESKAARERQGDMIKRQNIPNDSLKNQSLPDIPMPWVYPDTRRYDNTSSSYAAAFGLRYKAAASIKAIRIIRRRLHVYSCW